MKPGTIRPWLVRLIRKHVVTAPGAERVVLSNRTMIVTVIGTEGH
jgi:hypothetical protein